jgi:hypothetical protein
LPQTALAGATFIKNVAPCHFVRAGFSLEQSAALAIPVFCVVFRPATVGNKRDPVIASPLLVKPEQTAAPY